MKKIVALIAILLATTVYAQLDWQITDLRCGNDKLDDFELCDDDVDEGYCDELADLLRIDTICDDQHCTCLPRVNMAFCGNDKREGVEVCDGTAKDFCPEFGNITGMNLVCDPDTCGCKIEDTIPTEYDPNKLEELVNASLEPSVCGNKKLERKEECDPPNTLCTTNKDEIGICRDDCMCVTPEMLDSGTEETNITEETTNITEDTNASFEPVPEVVDVNETKEEKEEKPGFFGRIWAWIISIFS